MDAQTLQEAREKAQAIIARIQTDPIYGEQLRRDPERALLDAGLPEAAVGQFLAEAGISPEVAGYQGIGEHTLLGTDVLAGSIYPGCRLTDLTR